MDGEAVADKPGPPVCGVILVDKEPGMTSHDVVDRIRRLTGIRKVGHGGTLDPSATGLLLMLVGKATRFFDYLAPLEKQYLVTVQFGATSSTGDIDGEITATGGSVSREALEETLAGFTGVIRQQVPAYSAVKVGGEPLYRKARRGDVVDAPVREVEISHLRVESFNGDAQQAEIAVTCAKGTYIRSLCEDIGAALDSGAYAWRLRRTAIGDWRADTASTLAELETLPRSSLLADDNPAFISCTGALYFLPVREVTAAEEHAVSFGQPLEGEASGPVRLSAAGRLLAIYGPGKQAGRIYPKVILV